MICAVFAEALRLCWCVSGAASRPVKKRSEVDRRLEQLVLKQSWKLKEPSKQSVIKVSAAAHQHVSICPWSWLIKKGCLLHARV
jgi:hypothetical protein